MPGTYTERLSEVHEVLAHIPADSETVEINSGRLLLERYHRAAVLISVGDMAGGATFDVDVEQANQAAGGTLKVIAGKSTTQLTQAGGDGDQVLIIEIRSEELDVTGGFEYINVECTPAVAAVEFAVFVLGTVSRYNPVPTTNVAEIVD